MKTDASLFAAWIRLSRSAHYHWIPLALFLWGVGILLLSYVSGNFWLERRPTARLAIEISVDGKIVHTVHPNEDSPDQLAVPSGQATVATQIAAPRRNVYVGYILHFNWSLWNALIVPLCSLVAVWLYRSIDTIAASLVQRKVVSITDASQDDTREKVREFLDEVTPAMEAAFFLLSIILIVTHVWNDARDFNTSLGFSEPHIYPLAYDFGSARPPQGGMIVLFLFVAYAGTYFSLIVLAHFAVWAVHVLTRLSRLIPRINEKHPDRAEDVTIQFNGEVAIFTVRLRHDDKDKHFGVGSLARLFDGIHWIAAGCVLIFPLMRVGEILREGDSLGEQPQAWLALGFSLVGTCILFFLPFFLTSEKVWRYKTALEDNGVEVNDQKIWPAGSLPVSFLLVAVIAAVSLPILESINVSRLTALSEWWKVAGASFSMWFTGGLFPKGPWPFFRRPASQGEH